MHLFTGLSKAQRVVVVVALGIALAALGRYLVSLGGARTGWYAYTPLTSGGFAPPRTGVHAWLRLIIWLGLTGVWALASVALLRPKGGAGDDE